MPKTNIEITAENKTTKAFTSVQSSLSKLSTSLSSTMGKAKTSFGKFNNSLTSTGGKMAALIGIGGTGALTKNLLDMSTQLADTSKQLGINTTDLQKFELAATQTGATSEQFFGAMAKLNKEMGDAAEGNKVAIDKFDRLGVSLTDATGKARDTEDIFLDVADSVSKIEDSAQKGFAVDQIFGRGGGKTLIPLLSQGATAIKDMGSEFEKAGSILDEKFIKNANATDSALGQLKKTVQVAFSQVLSELLPLINSTAKAIGVMAGKFSKFAEKNPRFIKVGLALAGTLAAVSLSMVVLTPLVSALGLASSKTFTAVTSLGKSLLALNTPILVGIGVVAALGMAWFLFSDEIKTAVFGALDYATQTFGEFKTYLETVFAPIAEFVGGVFNGISGSILSAIKTGVQLASDAIDVLPDFIKDNLPAGLKIGIDDTIAQLERLETEAANGTLSGTVATAMATAAGKIAGSVTAPLAQMATDAGLAVGKVATAITAPLAQMKTDAQTEFNDLSTWITENVTFDNMSENVAGAFDTINGKMEGLTDDLADDSSPLLALKEQADDATGSVVNLSDALVGVTFPDDTKPKPKPKATPKPAPKLPQSVGDYAQEGALGVAASIPGVGGAISGFQATGEPMGAVVGAILDLVTKLDAFNLILDLVGDVLELVNVALLPLTPVLDEISELLSEMKPAFELMALGLTPFMKRLSLVLGIITKLITTIENAFGPRSKHIENVFNSFTHDLENKQASHSADLRNFEEKTKADLSSFTDEFGELLIGGAFSLAQAFDAGGTILTNIFVGEDSAIGHIKNGIITACDYAFAGPSSTFRTNAVEAGEDIATSIKEAVNVEGMEKQLDQAFGEDSKFGERVTAFTDIFKEANPLEKLATSINTFFHPLTKAINSFKIDTGGDGGSLGDAKEGLKKAGQDAKDFLTGGRTLGGRTLGGQTLGGESEETALEKLTKKLIDVNLLQLQVLRDTDYRRSTIRSGEGVDITEMIDEKIRVLKDDTNEMRHRSQQEPVFQ